MYKTLEQALERALGWHNSQLAKPNQNPTEVFTAGYESGWKDAMALMERKTNHA